MAYLVAPLVAIFFALIGNILVMALCKLKLVSVVTNYNESF